jgi:magnesium transporter
MNFDTKVSKWNMPELEWAYGYPAALGFMLFIALFLLVYFKWRRWL